MDKERESFTAEDDVIDLGLLIHDFFRGFKKFWWMVLVLGIVFAGAVYLRAHSTYVPMYRSVASFTIMTSDSTNQNYYYNFFYDQSTAEQMAATFPYILESDLLTDLVKQDLGVSYINGSISAKAIANSNLCTITVTGREPVEVYQILSSVIENYPRVSQYVMGDTMLNLIELPQVPTEPFNLFSPYRSTAKAGLVGFALGFVLIGLYALTRKTIRKEEEIRSVLNVPCLGTIPQVKFRRRNKKSSVKLSILNERTGEVFAEAVRGIALRMSRQMEEKKEQILMVTGTMEQEGCTSVAKNLAAAMTALGKMVVLISYAEPVMEKRRAGRLELVLSGRCAIEDAFVYDEDYGIWTISGRNTASGISGHKEVQNMKWLLEQLKQMVDVIIIDAPPCMQMSSAAVIAECSDTAVYVIRQDFSKTRKVMEGIEELCSFDLDFAGCILNQTQHGLAGYGYGYGKYGRYYNKYGYRYYGRYYGRDRESKREKQS